MDVAHEIAKRVGELPPSVQEQVLRYVVSLGPVKAPGEEGAALHVFSGALDLHSAQEIQAEIEKECEKIDPSE